MRWPSVATATAIMVALVAACAAPTPAPAPVWQQVRLPGGVLPSSLAVAGDRLLVGGFDPTATAPALLQLGPDGAAELLDLAPEQEYAQVADLVALSPAAGSVIALGVARGGAHGNQRWTTWDGRLDGVISDHQQGFWTFGGHEAGPLLAVLRPGGEPVIVGSRGVEAGFAAALWTSRGTTWTRQPALDPQLVSGPDRVLSFRAAAASGRTILIAGAEIGLAGGVRQSPVAWLGSVAGPWRTVQLPLPDEPGSATGLAQASSAACGSGEGSPCWVAGWVRGQPVVWEVDPVAATAQATLLPGAGGSGTDPTSVVGLLGTVPVVLTNADEPALAWRCGGSWRTAAAPAGDASALASLGQRLYAVTGEADGRRLWQTELDTLGC